MEYYSAIKKDEVMPFAATWMQLEIIRLSELSQKEKDKYHMISLICRIWHKYGTNELIYKTETDSDIENRLVVAKGVGAGRGMDWEFGVSRCKLLHLEWIDNKVLMYSTGNYIQSPGISHNGKEYTERMYICV